LGLKDADCSHLLGQALVLRRDIPGALQAFRTAVRQDAGNPDYHVSLGTALRARGDEGPALESYRRALEINPLHGPAYYFLGEALTGQGRFAEALQALQTAQQLRPRYPNWPYPTARGLQTLQGYLAVEQKLGDYLAERLEPASVEERTQLAWVCRLKGLDLAAVKHYERAFQKQPQLADNLASKTRFHAACSALRAGCGKSKDNPKPEGEAAAGLRRKALEWFTAELRAYQRLAGSEDPPTLTALVQRLRFWKTVPDLTCVQGDEALQRLTADERAGWKQLLEDIDTLLEKTSHAIEKSNK
jgi:tetratricopeptide (TPR) repeat protein